MTDGLAGTPAEIVDRLGEFGKIGADGAYLQVLDLHDLDHLELIAAEVLPQVVELRGSRAVARGEGGRS